MAYLLVGLGNPGPDYAQTRHNAGFMAVDAIIRRYNFSAPQTKYKGELGVGEINGQKVYALKPMTFMNKSGSSVQELVRFYKIPLEHIIVLYDELDIPVGKVKAKTGGGAGGHNGIRDIDASIGKDYRRIRIGIDHPGDASKVTSYVLKPFRKEERIALEPVLDAIADTLPTLINGGSDADFTTNLALKLNPPSHTPKPKPQSEKGMSEE